MAAPGIGIRNRWAAPTGKVDRSHPLTVGLAAVGCGSQEFVGAVVAALAPSVPRGAVPTPFGKGLTGAAAASDGGYLFGYGYGVLAPYFDFSTTVTLAAWVNVSASNAGAVLGFGNVVGTTGMAIAVSGSTADTTGNTLIALDSAVAWRDPTSGVLAAGWRHIAATGTRGGVYHFYVDGLPVGSTVTCNYIVPDQLTYIRVAGETTTTRATTCPLGPWHVYTRVLSDKEIATLAAAPFCMMRR